MAHEFGADVSLTAFETTALRGSFAVVKDPHRYVVEAFRKIILIPHM